MVISKERQKGTLILFLEGRLDSLASSALEKELAQANDKEVTELVLDFKKVEYVASSGLRVLMSTYKAMMKRDGMMKLRHVSDSVMEILEITNLVDIFDIE